MRASCRGIAREKPMVAACCAEKKLGKGALVRGFDAADAGVWALNPPRPLGTSRRARTELRTCGSCHEIQLGSDVGSDPICV